jgi:hypothetical protein
MQDNLAVSLWEQWHNFKTWTSYVEELYMGSYCSYLDGLYAYWHFEVHLVILNVNILMV